MPYILKKYYPWRNLVFVFGEGVLIFFIINMIFLSWSGVGAYRDAWSIFVFRAIVVTLVFHLCFYYFDLYDNTIIPWFSDHLLKVIQTFGFGCIVLAFIYHFFPTLNMSDRIFWSGLVAVGVAIVGWRFAYFRMLEKQMFAHPIAVIGTGRFAGEIIAAIEKKKDCGFKISALVGARNTLSSAGRFPVYSTVKDLESLCSNRHIETIVLALDEKRGTLPMHELIQYKFMGIEVLDGLGFYESLAGKVPVERVNPSWLLFSEGFYVGRVTRMLKRTLDISVALTMLLVSLPVFLISAVVIKLESPGEVFYRQDRVGENGLHFKIIKFRSMRADAEQNGPVWAASEDDRVTRFGRCIRKVRIDELPQLINVLKGDMSFVGPRPERPVFVEELAKSIPYYTVRHVVKPGITGWAQINYPYGASVEDALRKLEYDFYYIKNLSIGMDLATIFQTIKVVLFQKGAR